MDIGAISDAQRQHLLRRDLQRLRKELELAESHRERLEEALRQAIVVAHYCTDEDDNDQIKLPMNEWSRLVTAAKGVTRSPTEEGEER